MTRLLTFLIPAVIIVAAFPARAERLYALSMHGSEYNQTSEHLSYVNPAAPKGGTLKQSAIGSFDTLNPYNIKGKPAEGLNLTTDRLMARVWDEPFTMVPLVAQSVDVPEDRSSVIFNLNDKARFHDGAPITANDVLFSYETLKKYGRPNMRRIYQLATPEILDPHRIQFTFGEGYDRETVMIFALMPILSQTYWEDKSFDETTLTAPLSSGPYKITAIEPGRRVVYERVKDYWGADLLANKGLYNPDKIIYDYYRDTGVAFQAFKAGEFDLWREWDAGQWHSAYDFPALKNGQIKAEALPHGRPDRVRGFIMNTRRAPFDDIRVREALSLLFDFEWANKNLFYNQYHRIDSFYPNTDLAADGLPAEAEKTLLAPWQDQLPESVYGPAYQPPVNATPQDKRANMRKADALLNEAGWTVQNGVRMKDGKPLSFEMLVDDPSQEKLALSYTNALSKMGVQARVRVLDAAAFTRRITAYDFDMMLYFWLSTLSPGTEQYLYWSCESAKTEGRWNYAGICHPAVDALSQSIADAKNRDDLRAHTSALDRIMMNGHYFVPLYYNDQDFAAYQAKIHRPDTTPLYGIVTESWWIGE